jgi:hypothetical protein
MKLGKTVLRFTLGGMAYVGLEWLWRGRSHYSMFLAGGSCFLLLGALERSRRGIPGAMKAGVGAVMITAVELITGLIFNREYTVWDYRELPLNFLGQICVPFTLLWIPVSILAMALYDVADRKI